MLWLTLVSPDESLRGWVLDDGEVEEVEVAYLCTLAQHKPALLSILNLRRGMKRASLPVFLLPSQQHHCTCCCDVCVAGNVAASIADVRAVEDHL